MNPAHDLRPDFSPVRGMRVLIALSGGADSVALAVLLAEARAGLGLVLFAAHLDHGIRPESVDDADFCRELCRGLDIPFFCRRVDIPAEAAKRHEGLETLARTRRYEWLEQVKRETRSDVIALAHHMDDQAETVLMHLGRGAGPEGLGGMKPLSGGLYRPLLSLRKAELKAYLEARGMGWREDATNYVDDTPRNMLRLRAMPELERCYPQFARSAARYAQAQRIENDYMASQTEAWLEGRRDGGPFGRCLEVFPPPHPAILRRALRAVCPEALDWEQVNALEALCGQRRGKLDLSKHWRAERAGRRLYFVPKAPAAVEPAGLRLDGVTRLQTVCEITARPCEAVPVRDDPLRQALNPEALRGAVLRTRREGDRIRPLNGGDRLLSDYLIDKKIDRPLRDRVALAAVGNRVLWVCGLGISDEAALRPGDGAVRLTCQYDTNNGFYGGMEHAQ